jgi:hypothetical protein
MHVILFSTISGERVLHESIQLFLLMASKLALFGSSASFSAEGVSSG